MLLLLLNETVLKNNGSIPKYTGDKKKNAVLGVAYNPYDEQIATKQVMVDIVNAAVPFIFLLLKDHEENRVLFLKLHGLDIVGKCVKHMFDLVRHENEFLQPSSSPRGSGPRNANPFSAAVNDNYAFERNLEMVASQQQSLSLENQEILNQRACLSLTRNTLTFYFRLMMSLLDFMDTYENKYLQVKASQYSAAEKRAHAIMRKVFKRQLAEDEAEGQKAMNMAGDGAKKEPKYEEDEGYYDPFKGSPGKSPGRKKGKKSKYGKSSSALSLGSLNRGSTFDGPAMFNRITPEDEVYQEDMIMVGVRNSG